jgi:membrane protease YdiL (CAAX protease family)
MGPIGEEFLFRRTLTPVIFILNKLFGASIYNQIISICVISSICFGAVHFTNKHSNKRGPINQSVQAAHYGYKNG